MKYVSPLFRRECRCFYGCIKKFLHDLSHVSPDKASVSLDIQSIIKQHIKASGPISVSKFMKYSLTHPNLGYYMKKDVFGVKGDFTTAPEVSQMFGELIGVWCLNEWKQRGSGCPVQLVELGPGRGTLADDILRCWAQFDEARNKVSLHLVEVSDKMTDMQFTKLSGSASASEPPTTSDAPHHRHCLSKHGIPVYWYRHISQIPKSFSCFICQEFFDALPIYIFKFKDNAWQEVCIDNNTGSDGFRYVLRNSPPLWGKLLIKDEVIKGRTHIEVSPEGGAIAELLANRIAEFGGAALIADYGHNGDKCDTFRGFKNHGLHDPLIDPGSADLTADVDFSYLHNIVSPTVCTHGPVSQASFLTEMGIGVRLKMLLQKGSEHNRGDLISGFRYLTDPEQMGELFKFFAMTPNDKTDYTPAGFTSNYMNTNS